MAHRIHLLDSGQDFSCRPDQHLLQGMAECRATLAFQASIPVGCRGGGCGVCRIRVLGGDYETRKMSIRHVTPEEQSDGVLLACRVFPRSDLRIKLMPIETPTAESSSA